MKQPEKFTRRQKEIVSANGLNPNDWMFVKDLNESYMVIVNKTSKSQKVIDKTRRKKR